MPTRHPPIAPRILHGGDYNPEQWERLPGIWDEDVRLMRLAGVTVTAVGIFSWARLEPEEGRYDFAWLDDIIARLHVAGVGVILATPSGAKPNWLALKHDEVRRCGPDGRREPQQGRHNHCWTSPIYREKVRSINTRLAERYGKHPALLLWHLSNEYGGECHCPLCFASFRQWLKERYGSVEAMNRAWWSAFWSHSFTSFDQVTTIDWSVHGLALDWKRFTTAQCVDFMRAEIEPLKRIAPRIPVTTNLMGSYPGLDYWRLAPHLDVVSWDTYPDWHGGDSDLDVACDTAFHHDLNRALKRRTWLQMEATPSVTNWRRVSRLKRPGVHRLASLQSVAHGADAVCYFQWRKSRGSSEKFHGAVVDHVGHEHTRVFREVAALGGELAKLGALAGAGTDAQAAVILDWESRWAFESAAGPRNADRNYVETCVAHYRPLWRRGIAVDVIESACDLSPYRLVVAPMLYLLKPGVAERFAAFVAAGGTLVATYCTGLVDESDLCFLGGWPGGGLRQLFGVWCEEHDALPDQATQTVVAQSGNAAGLSGTYTARHYCDVLHAEGAEVLATYGGEFYAGQPAATRRAHGKGQAFYVGSRNDARFTDDLLGAIADRLALPRALPTLPDGVSATRRGDGEREWLFVLNFTPEPRSVDLGSGWTDALSRQPATASLTLAPWGASVLERGAR